MIGAGHNGLVAAAYLAKAGRKVVVLERRDVAGGILANSELAPGVRSPSLVHTVGRLRDSVVKDLKLGGHGLELISPEVRAFAPQPDGAGITFYADRGPHRRRPAFDQRDPTRPATWPSIRRSARCRASSPT